MRHFWTPCSIVVSPCSEIIFTDGTHNGPREARRPPSPTDSNKRWCYSDGVTENRRAEDPRIRQAVEIGAKNRRTLNLLKNWCANVGIKKYGGVGLVEQMTGDPIGHHFVVCEHARPGGMASFDLEESAVQFYDTNCVGCSYRKPVGLPNLAELVAERDAVLRRKELEEERFRQDADAARAVRRAERATLRKLLNPVQATLVDQLEALDGGGRETSDEALVTTAGLAPEAFAPQLVEHLFHLLETSEHWATGTALNTLRTLRAEPGRLVRCAVLALRRRHAERIAAEVIADGVAFVLPDDVPEILAPLVELACPLRRWVLDREPEPVPGPLLTLHGALPRAVEAALEGLIWSQDLGVVGMAARGILVVAGTDRSAAVRLSRATISKLARGLDIPDRESGERDILDDLRTAAGDAFEHDPKGTDELMGAFQQGATNTGCGRVFSVYREVLDRNPKSGGDGEVAQDLALRRLLEAATGPMTAEVQQEVEEAFRQRSDNIREMAKGRMDALLGAAALLDERLRGPDELTARATNFIERMEAQSRRSGLIHIRDNLVNWVAKAASGDPGRIQAYLSVLVGLPEESEVLRGQMVGHLSDLVTSPETFAAILPPLYSALVGASTLARARAAHVIGQLSERQREDAPPLLLEAFVTLLSDPFVLPASSVVSALRHMDLPAHLDARVGNRLAAVIQANAESRNNSAFVVSCIRFFVNRHLKPEQRAGKAGEWLVGVLALHSPEYYARELRFFPEEFGVLPGFGQLVVMSMNDAERMSYGADDVYAALRMLDATALEANRIDLLNMALASGDNEEGFAVRGVLIEVFGKVGDWNAATQVAERAVTVVPDTRQDAIRRLTFQSLFEAVRLERAIAEGRVADVSSISAEWRRLQRQLSEARR